ncbi:MAG: thioredoxin family protein [Bacteroidetes bacterium]|nr:thioredoxin family protein [Bacteroidota bacterium]
MKTLAFSVLSLLAFLLSGQAFAQGNQTIPTTYGVGDAVEDFSLKNVDGRNISLYGYKGSKGVIVIFTCNHCPYAQLYEQRIIDLHKKYKDKGFPVLAVNPNSPDIVPEDSFGEMQNRARQKKYPFAYLFDEFQEVYQQFGATRTPHVFLLDNNMIVRYIGAIDDNPEAPNSIKNRWLENALDSLLAGRLPNPDFTRAVGCTIKKKP